MALVSRLAGDRAHQAEGFAKSSLAARFRPKNFSKPEVKVEQTVAHATASSGPNHGNGPKMSAEKERQGRHGSLSGRRKKQARDEVTFGGGVGVASALPKAAKKMIHPIVEISDEREKPKSREVVEKKMEIAEVKEEEPMDSPSSDDEALTEEDVYGPTVIQLPEKMARDVGDIDTERNREECTNISDLFDEQSDGFFLLQIPEKLPIRASTTTGEFGNEMESCSSLQDVSDIKIGKLILTKKGQVKMKIGNVIMDVSKSISCKERQEFACVDRAGGRFVSLGPIHTRLAVTPNISLLLNSNGRQQWEKGA